MAFDLTCLATRKAKRRSAQLGGGGRAPRHRPCSSISSTTALSRDCTSIPPATDLKTRPGARGSGRPPASSSRKFFLAPTIAIASALASGAMITSVKISVMARGRLGVERPIERHDAAECGHRIAGERLAIGVDQACALGNPARIGMLDDDAGSGARGIEFRHAFIGRVGVVDVVVGELACPGPGGQSATPRRASAVR